MSLFYTISLLWEFFALLFKTKKTQQVSGYIYFLPFRVSTLYKQMLAQWQWNERQEWWGRLSASSLPC